jgi:SAM-dependent methyltransferase
VSTKHWDETVGKVESQTLKGWLDWEFIEEEYIRPAVSGDRHVYYLTHFLDTHCPRRPVRAALSLGCGGGNLERGLIAMNAAEVIDAFDVSPESIRLAKQLAEEAGCGSRIHYAVSDINTLILPPRKYDFVIAKMALHHFHGLEHIFAQVRGSLKEGGVFVFNEFIGPNRFQWSDLQLQLMNSILAALPQKNRRSAISGDVLQRIDRPSVAAMIAMDPSEAIRSQEIMPVLQRFFELVEYKPYGGTLLHILLTHLMPTFDQEDEDQAALVKMLFLLERTLIEHKVLGSDFAYVVARPLQTAPVLPPLPNGPRESVSSPLPIATNTPQSAIDTSQPSRLMSRIAVEALHIGRRHRHLANLLPRQIRYRARHLLEQIACPATAQLASPNTPSPTADAP